MMCLPVFGQTCHITSILSYHRIYYIYIYIPYTVYRLPYHKKLHICHSWLMRCIIWTYCYLKLLKLVTYDLWFMIMTACHFISYHNRSNQTLSYHIIISHQITSDHIMACGEWGCLTMRRPFLGRIVVLLKLKGRPCLATFLDNRVR